MAALKTLPAAYDMLEQWLKDYLIPNLLVQIEQNQLHHEIYDWILFYIKLKKVLI